MLHGNRGQLRELAISPGVHFSIPMPSDRESVLRFDLAVQKSHPLVYTAAFFAALAAHALGVFVLNMPVGIAILCSTRRVTRVDVCAVTPRRRPAHPQSDLDRRPTSSWSRSASTQPAASPAPGSSGISPPPRRRRSCVGKKASYLVSLANAVAYIAVLMVMGQATFVNSVLLLAVARMLFLFGASFFFLAGIANLQQKRLQHSRARRRAGARGRRADAPHARSSSGEPPSWRTPAAACRRPIGSRASSWRT